ncbi:MAG TPA: hypothetical protein QF468_00405 [Nitrospinota bacterium]|jgi:hypothetical protein|nr:hypothetical protein [Nitrospinota bacterium]|tara:strand:+ start:1230 stop:3329 length:2100 start_codon:yes stop_codon:yes gene_type:complete
MPVFDLERNAKLCLKNLIKWRDKILKILNRQNVHFYYLLFLALLILFYARGWLNKLYPVGYSIEESMVNIIPTLHFKEFLLMNNAIPNWSDYSYWGRPFLAKFPFLSFLIISLISIVFNISILTSWKILVITCLFLGALFVYMIVYRLTINPKASFISATIFALVPFHSGNTSTVWFIAPSWALIPLLFMVYFKFFSEMNYENAIKFCLLSTILLAFSIQYSVIGFFFLGIFSLFCIFAFIDGKTKPLQKIIKFHSFLVILLLLLFSFVWVPFALVEDTSAFDIALGGRNVNYEVSVNPKLTFFYQRGFLKDVFYVSPLFFFMVLLSFFSNEKEKYIWIIMFVVSTLLILGKYSPIDLYLFVNHIPFINKIRFPFRYMYITILSGSILCGLGYQWAENKIELFLNRYKAKAVHFFFFFIFTCFLLLYIPFGSVAFKSTDSYFLEDDIKAYKWIAHQDGYFRILEFPRNFKYALSPLIHKKKTVFGAYQEEVTKSSYLLESYLRNGIAGLTDKNTSLIEKMRVSNIKFIIFHRDSNIKDEILLRNGIVFEKAYGKIKIYRNVNFLPYATLYKTLMRNSSTNFLPDKYISTVLKVKKASSEQIEINLPSRPFSALLVIAESYDTNWHVTSNGKDKKVIPITPNFMGVKVLEEESKLVFAYKENIIEKVANIITVGIFILLAVGLFGFRLFARLKRFALFKT